MEWREEGARNMGELGFCLHLVEKMQLYIISLIPHKHEQFHKEGVDSREKDFAIGGSQGRLSSAWSSEKLPEIGPGLHSHLRPEIEGAQISQGRAPGFLRDARSQRRSEDKGRGHKFLALHVGQHLSPMESWPAVNTFRFCREKGGPQPN